MNDLRAAFGTLIGIILVVSCTNAGTDGSAQQPATNADTTRELATATTAVDDATNALIQREEFVVECMAERGFEYIPDDVGTPIDIEAELDLYQEINFQETEAVQLARDFGFGLFSDPQQIEMALADANQAPDPNDEIRNSLTDDERNAYSEALAGDNIADNDVRGCLEIADERFPDPGANEELGVILIRLERDFDQRLSADRRMISAEQALEKCYGEAGFDLSNRTAVEYMKERFRQLTGLEYDDVGFAGLDQASMSTVETLQAEERELAEVDATCQARYFEVRDQIGTELEQEMIEENPDVVALSSSLKP